MADMADLVARLGKKISPDTNYPFLTPDLQQIIVDAINQHNPQYSVDTLPEPEEYLILWLARIQVYLTLAAKYAEDFSIGANGDKYGLDQPHIHYMNMAEKLTREYSALAIPSIQVSTFTRVDLRTGRKSSLFPGDLQ